VIQLLYDERVLLEEASATMRGSPIITLFAPAPPPSQPRLSGFVVSPVLHLVVFLLILLWVKHAPPENHLALSRTYIVRLLNLHTVQPPRHVVKDNTPRPAEHASRHLAAEGGIPVPPSILEDQPPSRITLIQPDAPKVRLTHEIPLPTVVIWSPGVQKNINPPPLPPTPVPLVRASVELPNTEQAIANINITATPFQTSAPMPLPTAVSPMTLQGKAAAGQVPQTAAPGKGIPTGGRVLSLSDLQMADGTVVIPLANQVVSGSGSGIVLRGLPQGTAPGGSGDNKTSKEGGSAGSGEGDTGTQVADAGGTGDHRGAGNGTDDGDASLGNGSGPPITPSTTRITQAKNGHFEVVVVGTSVSDEYPEAAKVWNGRMAYTVYLHVGVSKNWILQYSLPATAETASVAGEGPRLSAPWPYVILRPNLVTPNTDGILIHGLLNAAGRLEKMALIFPDEFADTKFILDSLKQWDFRPAMQNGQAAAVEVLLIIPTDNGG
jgi:hypothetical protein